jgi:hypothetical protein
MTEPPDQRLSEDDTTVEGGEFQSGCVDKSFETAETEAKKSFDHQSLDDETKMLKVPDQLALTEEHDTDSVLLNADQQALNEDIFSLMSTAPIFSGGYIYAFSIFLIQGAFLVLICKWPRTMPFIC